MEQKNAWRIRSDLLTTTTKTSINGQEIFKEMVLINNTKNNFKHFTLSKALNIKTKFKFKRLPSKHQIKCLYWRLIGKWHLPANNNFIFYRLLSICHDSCNSLLTQHPQYYNINQLLLTILQALYNILLPQASSPAFHLKYSQLKYNFWEKRPNIFMI